MSSCGQDIQDGLLRRLQLCFHNNHQSICYSYRSNFVIWELKMVYDQYNTKQVSQHGHLSENRLFQYKDWTLAVRVHRFSLSHSWHKRLPQVVPEIKAVFIMTEDNSASLSGTIALSHFISSLPLPSFLAFSLHNRLKYPKGNKVN